MSDTQSPEIVNVLERLVLGDRSTDQPFIDETRLSAVFNIDPGWLGVRPKLWYVTNSINGASVTVEDTDTGFTEYPIAAEEPVSAQNQRYYQSILVHLYGGAVSPIDIQFFLAVGGIVCQLFTVQSANPSHYTYGPFYVPPGAVLRMRNNTNGGVGDNMAIYAVGFQAKPGVPLPLIAPITAGPGGDA